MGKQFTVKAGLKSASNESILGDKATPHYQTLHVDEIEYLEDDETPSKFYTITAMDVDKPYLIINGERLAVSSFLGRVMLQDVGKRVYALAGVASVENKEHFERRMKGGQ